MNWTLTIKFWQTIQQILALLPPKRSIETVAQLDVWDVFLDISIDT